MAISIVRPSVQTIDTTVGSPALQNQAQCTIVCWILLPALPVATGRLWSISTATSTGRAVLQISTTGALTHIARRLDAGGSSTISGVGTLIANTVHCVAAVMNYGSDFHGVYIDGTLVGSTVPGWSGTVSNTASLQCILGASGAGGEALTATVHEWRIYRRALSAAELIAITTAKGGDRVRNGLYHRWLMNGGASGVVGANSVKDLGPGALNCSGLNSPTWVGAPLRTRPRAA